MRLRYSSYSTELVISKFDKCIHLRARYKIKVIKFFWLVIISVIIILPRNFVSKSVQVSKVDAGFYSRDPF